MRYARQLAGASARELDRLTDHAEGHLAAIETKIHDAAQLNTVGEYARVLGVDLGWIFDGTGPEPTAEIVVLALDRARSAAADSAARAASQSPLAPTGS